MVRLTAREAVTVPVFRYVGVKSEREEREESGTVRARDKDDAKKKLEPYGFSHIRLKPLGGLSGIFGSLTADVK